MTPLVLSASTRLQHGSAHARRIRHDKRLPGVVYGARTTPFSVSVDYTEFIQCFGKARQHQLISLKIDDGKETLQAIIKDCDYDPVTKRPRHIDFYRAQDAYELTARIPIRLVGTPIGSRSGGITEFFVPEISVRCLPKILREYIDLSVEHLDIGNAIYIRDIPFPEGMSTIMKGQQCIVRVTASRATKVAASAAGE